MEAAQERLAAIVDAERRRLKARSRSAVILNAVLLVALFWFTTWLSLRLGLLILLVGNGILLAGLLLQTRKLARQSQAIKNDFERALPAHWFEDEARFLKRLAVLENLSRALGFLFLGWGFWTATRSLLVAALLGVAYPLFAYFGMDRPRQARALRSLRVEEEAFTLHTRRPALND